MNMNFNEKSKLTSIVSNIIWRNESEIGVVSAMGHHVLFDGLFAIRKRAELSDHGCSSNLTIGWLGIS